MRQQQWIRDRQFGGRLESQKSKDTRKSYQGGESNSHGFDREEMGNGPLSEKQIVGMKRGRSKGGSANTKKQKAARKQNRSKGGNRNRYSASSIYITFDKDDLLYLLKKVEQKSKYNQGISLIDMHGVYEKAVSKKGMKKKMFPFNTLRDKFSTRNGKYASWVKESIEIVSSVYGKTIIKSKKR